jgi:hypothetical protein
MSKRGPKRLVTSAFRIGAYGKTSWHLILDCGHEHNSARKPEVGGTKVSCKKCIPVESTALATVSASHQDLVYGLVDPDDPMGEIKMKAAIASKFDVSMDQVQIGGSTATVFLDAQQVKDIIA